MKLTDAQLAEFDEKGYLFLPGLFSKDEAAVLKAAARDIYASDREEVWREKSGVPRIAFAAHTYDEAHRMLGAHPRLVEPIMQILGEQVYMHQYKINAKAPFDGAVWQWHQDYGTWLNDDMMPEPRAMNVAIFLDEVNEFNGPLIFIPGSHRDGVVDASHDTTTTSYPLWTVNNQLITQLVQRAGGLNGGIISPKGPPGSMMLFHGCLLHASSSNLSPWNRNTCYLSLCAVSNHIRRFKRPEYIAHRDFTPIECLPDDCLLNDYPVDLPWKDGMPASALETSLDVLKEAA